MQHLWAGRFEAVCTYAPKIWRSDLASLPFPGRSRQFVHVRHAHRYQPPHGQAYVARHRRKTCRTARPFVQIITFFAGGVHPVAGLLLNYFEFSLELINPSPRKLSKTCTDDEARYDVRIWLIHEEGPGLKGTMHGTQKQLLRPWARTWIHLCKQ